MKHRPFTFSMVAAMLMGLPIDGLGQGSPSDIANDGLFGPQVFGRPLQPAPQKMFSGILLGPAGQFIGVGRPNGGMMFGPAIRSAFAPTEPDLPPMPEQLRTTLSRENTSRQAVQPRAAIRPAPTVQRPTPVQSEAPPQPQPAPPQPDQWLRLPSRGSMSARMTAPAGGRPLASSAVGAPSAGFSPRLSLGFAPASAPGDAGAALTSLLDRSAEVQKRSPISVTVQGDTALLRGAVATGHDRALAELLIRLEPGIWRVQNELLVEGQPRQSQGVSVR